MQLNAFPARDQHLSDVQPQQSGAAVHLSPIDKKPVLLDFTGGQLSSDGGLLLLNEIDRQIGLTQAMAEALSDSRDPRYTLHSLQDMLRQRTYQIEAGYDDQNDADRLRDDPVLKMVVGREPISGVPLASQPTLSRFENAPSWRELFRMGEVFLDQFIASYREQPSVIVLDFDDTEARTHGAQQLSLFNYHYRNYCYSPLHVYEGLSGRFITALLKGKRLNGLQVRAMLRRIVRRLRRRWPETTIIFRGDSHFTYPEVMAYLDEEPLAHYVTGLGSNEVLKRLSADVTRQTEELYRRRSAASKEPVKVTRFHSFVYRARSWKRLRRVVVKIEVSKEGTNRRYVVTDFEKAGARTVYRQIYCARGKAELYIKDHKTYLHSDRMSCHRFEANQFRLFLHSAAYVLYDTLRREILGHTALSKATMETLRLKLVKIGTRVKQLKTRIRVILPSSCPEEPVLRHSFEMLALLRPT